MASPLSPPLTPRSELRTELVRLNEEAERLAASLQIVTQKVVDLTNRGEGFSNPLAKQEAGMYMGLADNYQPVDASIRSLLGFQTVAYFAKGGSLQDLARAMKKTPVEQEEFTQKFQSVYEKYRPK